jgi:lysophospholipid acyltransferase (LPLAT)-like uncharacterized protein
MVVTSPFMTDAPEWQQSTLKRGQIAAIAGLGYPLMRALGATWSWKVSGAENLEAVAVNGHQPILSFWHGRIFPATLYFQRRGIVVITSENYDGEWIARIITRFGYGTARGSTSKGGSRALLQLVRQVKSTAVAFTLDGPRGPAEVAQPGAVWLSKATGNPLVPFHVEAASSWRLKSWDRTQIPKPFSKVALAIGAPLYVPRDADETALEEWRHKLQQSLSEVRSRCEQLLSSASG